MHGTRRRLCAARRGDRLRRRRGRVRRRRGAERATPAAERAAGRRPAADQGLPARAHRAPQRRDRRSCARAPRSTTRWPRRADFDYAKLLEDKRAEVQAFVEDAQETFAAANPAYEEMEGVVAGVPSLADYDVIIDAGGDTSDPENAVPFTLKTPARQDLQAARQLQLPDRDVRSTAPSRSSRPRASSPTSTATARSSSARRCPTPTSTSPPRATSRRPTQELDAAAARVGRRRRRTRSPRSS